MILLGGRRACKCARRRRLRVRPPQDTPTFVSLFAYFGFWALVIMDIIIKWRRGMLLDALAKTRRKEARATAKLARKQVRH